jgi:hypothetical protein
MEQTKESLKTHAIVEIMGQKKVAGYVTTEVFGSTCMLRVDIPETSRRIAFTQFYGMGSIYCLTPVDAETAKTTAESLGVLPPISWETEQLISRVVNTKVQAYKDAQKQIEAPPVTDRED